MTKPLDPVKELWPELEPLRKKFKVGTLVAYREPARWLSNWTDIPVSSGDTGIIEKEGAKGTIDLYGVRFFTCPENLHYLSSPWLEEVK